jgi:predicted HTH transcriptional regulator
MTSKTASAAAELIKERLRELEAERAQLERALASLTGGRQGRRGPGRPRGAAARRTGRGRGRRRNTRADQAVKLIKDNPGITASEIAKRMRIKPNYLYRVLGDLQKDGSVKKSGRAYSAG